MRAAGVQTWKQRRIELWKRVKGASQTCRRERTEIWGPRALGARCARRSDVEVCRSKVWKHAAGVHAWKTWSSRVALKAGRRGSMEIWSRGALAARCRRVDVEAESMQL